MTPESSRSEPDAGVWFEYAHTAGRFTAWPIRWQGWAAMLVLICGPVVGAVLIGKRAPDTPPLLIVMGALALCFGTIFPLAYFKGRPAKRSN